MFVLFIYSINIDSFGYTAVGCHNDGQIYLYNANNMSYLKSRLAKSSNYSLYTAVDASGRFVSMSGFAIDIYY